MKPKTKKQKKYLRPKQNAILSMQLCKDKNDTFSFIITSNNGEDFGEHANFRFSTGIWGKDFANCKLLSLGEKKGICEIFARAMARLEPSDIPLMDGKRVLALSILDEIAVDDRLEPFERATIRKVVSALRDRP